MQVNLGMRSEPYYVLKRIQIAASNAAGQNFTEIVQHWHLGEGTLERVEVPRATGRNVMNLQRAAACALS